MKHYIFYYNHITKKQFGDHDLLMIVKDIDNQIFQAVYVIQICKNK